MVEFKEDNGEILSISVNGEQVKRGSCRKLRIKVFLLSVAMNCVVRKLADSNFNCLPF